MRPKSLLELLKIYIKIKEVVNGNFYRWQIKYPIKPIIDDVLSPYFGRFNIPHQIELGRKRCDEKWTYDGFQSSSRVLQQVVYILIRSHKIGKHISTPFYIFCARNSLQFFFKFDLLGIIIPRPKKGQSGLISNCLAPFFFPSELRILFNAHAIRFQPHNPYFVDLGKLLISK